MYDSLSAASGVVGDPADIARRPARARRARQGWRSRRSPTHGKLVEELWEHFVKGGLTRPTFVMDFPLDTSPLVREHRSIPGVVEKWDLYVRGFELATGYSELVDPVIQRERFTEQAKLVARGDVEAMRIDEEFLRALEHGMPPSGGIGHGHRPAADGDHRARHPRDDPLPARQVGRALSRRCADGYRLRFAADSAPSDRAVAHVLEEPMTSVPEPPEPAPRRHRRRADSDLLGGSVRLLELESFRDDRGVLTPITFDDLGFTAARAFVVRAPQGAVRGGHAHRRVRQVLFCASWDDRSRRAASGRVDARLTLDEDRPAVLLEAGVWAQQTYIGADSTLIVFADGPYDPAEYADDDLSARRGPPR